MFGLCIAAVAPDVAKVALRIRGFQVQCRWQPSSHQSLGTDRCLDGAGRPQCMPVVTFCSADPQAFHVSAEDMLDSSGLGRVVKYCRTAVRIEILNLARNQLGIGKGELDSTTGGTKSRTSAAM